MKKKKIRDSDSEKIFQYECAITDISIDDCYKLMNLMPEQRKIQAEKYHKLDDKKRCIIAYGLLKHSLVKDFNIYGIVELIYGKYGRPSLKDYPEIYFSISHSGKWVIVSVGKYNHGIDIEQSQHDTRKLFNYVFSNNEKVKAERLNDLSADAYFVRLWTIKEAYIKLLGLGLHKRLSEIEVRDTEKCIVIYDKLKATDACCITQQNKDAGYWYSICAECDPKCVGKMETVSWENLNLVFNLP